MPDFMRFEKQPNNYVSEKEFMANQKKRGVIIYKCKQCGLRAFGAGKTLHESATKHTMVNEDKFDE
jgi:hypothetical protein